MAVDASTVQWNQLLPFIENCTATEEVSLKPSNWVIRGITGNEVCCQTELMNSAKNDCTLHSWSSFVNSMIPLQHTSLAVTPYIINSLILRQWKKGNLRHAQF